jgi:hypothetical protein
MDKAAGPARPWLLDIPADNPRTERRHVRRSIPERIFMTMGMVTGPMKTRLRRERHSPRTKPNLRRLGKWGGSRCYFQSKPTARCATSSACASQPASRAEHNGGASGTRHETKPSLRKQGKMVGQRPDFQSTPTSGRSATRTKPIAHIPSPNDRHLPRREGPSAPNEAKTARAGQVSRAPAPLSGPPNRQEACHPNEANAPGRPSRNEPDVRGTGHRNEPKLVRARPPNEANAPGRPCRNEPEGPGICHRNEPKLMGARHPNEAIRAPGASKWETLSWSVIGHWASLSCPSGKKTALSDSPTLLP